MSAPATKVDAEKNDNDNLPVAYEVGYGRPPAKHRFQKGQSGNPNGRPKGAKGKVPKGQGLDFGTQPANQMLLAEAYRTVTIREGEKILELPVLQAVFRAMGVSAMKGNRLAQATMAELVRGIEEEDRQLRASHIEAACEYKTGWEEAIEEARKRGWPEPTPIPHPDDVIIDVRRAEVRYEGPMTPEEKKDWDELLKRRDDAQIEVTRCASRYRKSRSEKWKTLWLSEWHYEQKMFDIINDRMPERYKRKLENRSYCEGASVEGKTLQYYLEQRRLKQSRDRG